MVANANVSTIANSYATGNVTSFYGNAGGLVGNTYNCSISSCYATGSVHSTEVTAGGLIGIAEGGTVNNSFAIGGVTADFYSVGGLIGQASYIVIEYTNGDGETDYREEYVSGTGNACNASNMNAIGDGSNNIDCSLKSTAELQSPALLESMGYTTDNGWRIENGVPVLMVFDPPAPTPTPTPTPVSDCKTWNVVKGDTMGAIMKTCTGSIDWSAMNAYANKWTSQVVKPGQTVYQGWNSGTGVGLYAGDTIKYSE